MVNMIDRLSCSEIVRELVFDRIDSFERYISRSIK